MSSVPVVDVVLPARNEEVTIGHTIASFASAVPDCRFIIIDNGSTDGTRSVALEALTSVDVPYLLLSEPQVGKGNAVRAGFRHCSAPVVILCDADDTYFAQDVHKLMKPVSDGLADMVIGDRRSSGAYREANDRAFHSAGNAVVLGGVNRIFGSSLHDVLSGYRAFSLAFVRAYPALANGFEIEVDLTSHALDKGFMVVEVPVGYRDRPAGSQSKLRTKRDGFRVLWTLMNLYRLYRPLPFMGAISLFLACLSVLCAIPPILDYVQYQYVYRVPLAILAAALGLASLLALNTALVLDALAGNARRAFSWQYRLLLERMTRS